MNIDRFIKVCGVREKSVFAAAAEHGASAVGLNFVSWSRRHIEVQAASDLLAWARQSYEQLPLIVGVFADENPDTIAELQDLLALELIQLHGKEPKAVVERFAPCLKAVGLSSEADLSVLEGVAPAIPLIDARVDGVVGGRGRVLDQDLVAKACARSEVIVAGGLDEFNVGEVIARHHPLGVDSASGTENQNGQPCPDRARNYILAARAAFNLGVG